MTRLVELLRRVIETDVDSRVDVPGFRYDPEELTSRNDVGSVLGITEREFVEAILVANGGRVWQATFTEYTDWSASQVSRLLGDLEASGAIARRKAGRENVVSLPRSGDTRGGKARRRK